MAIFAKVWKAVAAVAKSVACPWRGGGGRWFGVILRWTLHLVALVAALVGLWLLNDYLGLDVYVRAPQPWVARIWLPILFSLIYVLAWLGYGLWKLLDADDAPSAFPDIDASWQGAKRRLDQSGIDLSRTPLFLVLGRPKGGEASLFHASEMPFAVTPPPHDSDRPIQLWANADGIYVTCAGASVLGAWSVELASRAALETDDQPLSVEYSAAVDGAAPEPGLFNVQSQPWPAAPPAAAAASIAPARASGSAAVLEQEPEAPQPAADAPPAPQTPWKSLIHNTDVIEQNVARLAHLAETIREERHPFCPINGIMVLVPLAATDADREAHEAAVAIAKDLETIQESLCIRCPVIAVVCDTEESPGARVCLERFPDDRRRLRSGLEFPPVPERLRGEAPKMVRDGVQWICQVLIPRIVYRLLLVAPATADDDRTLRGNIDLYRYLESWRQRQNKLIRVLNRGILGQGDWILGGCYLAATGIDSLRERGFVSGIFPQLIAAQNQVAWTQKALDEDQRARRLARLGYFALTAVVAAILIVGIVW